MKVLTALILFPFFLTAQIVNKPVTDSCLSITFKEFLSIPGHFVIRDVTELPGGGFGIAGTYVESSSIGVTKAFIGRLNEYGDLIWIKSYGYNIAYTYCGFHKITLTIDNKLVVYAHSSSSFHNEQTTFLEFDLNGNLIWKKSLYFGSSSGSLIIYQTV